MLRMGGMHASSLHNVFIPDRVGIEASAFDVGASDGLTGERLSYGFHRSLAGPFL